MSFNQKNKTINYKKFLEEIKADLQVISGTTAVITKINNKLKTLIQKLG